MAETTAVSKTESAESAPSVSMEAVPAASGENKPAPDAVPLPKKPASRAGAGAEQQFQMFMNPMFAELEATVREQEKVLDRINDEMKKEREEREKARQQAHIPEPLKGRGQELKEVMKTVENMIQYEIEEEEAERLQQEQQTVPTEEEKAEKGDTEAEAEEEKEETRIQVPLQKLDEYSQAAVTAHSLAAYVSTLREDHLRKFTSKVTSDCQLWLSKMFRFGDASVLYHEEPRDGLVRICRLALYQKYPKYATEGFEALYSRPPVIYISSAAMPGLSNYLCLQLGLPMSCICSVPCNSLFGSSTKMDVSILEKLVQDDIAAAKTPVLLMGYAGTPVVGHVDDLEKLQELCKKHAIWLHVEGSNLATLGLLDVPSDILNARAGDSITVTMGRWLGIPALPYATLFKTSDPSLVHAAGLNTFNPHLKLNCLPMWVCLQSLGIEVIVERITHSCDLARLVFEKIEKIRTIKQISREANKESPPARSVGELITRAINSLLVFEMVTPTVVFKYQEDPTDLTGVSVASYAVSSDLVEEKDAENKQKMADYYSALNGWLADTLQLENPHMEIQAVDVEREGTCIRYAPLDSAQVLGTTEEHIEKFSASLKAQLSILDATVLNHTKFKMIVESHRNLRVVDVSNWAGLGAVQYIPEEYVEKTDCLTKQAVQEITYLNMDLVKSLKSTDMAFSLGHTDSEMACVKFGLITEETDVEELVGMVQSQGKIEEQSARYMENMADLVLKGIEEANKDLEEENQHKLMQEGVLRQVPIVGSLMNWWSPPPKDLMKGRRFNLVSGTIASTEDTYKYHMQIQEDSNPDASPRNPPPTPQSLESPTPELVSGSPQTTSAADVKAKLQISSSGENSESSESGIAEGKEVKESPNQELRSNLGNPMAQLARES